MLQKMPMRVQIFSKQGFTAGKKKLQKRIKITVKYRTVHRKSLNNPLECQIFYYLITPQKELER